MNFQKPFGREQLIWDNKVARESSSWAPCHTEEHVERPSYQSDIEDQNKGKRIVSYEFLLFFKTYYLSQFKGVLSTLRINFSGYMSFSFSQVVRFLVMHGMRMLPREIGNQKNSVQRISKGII